MSASYCARSLRMVRIMIMATMHDMTTTNPVAGIKPSDVLRPHKKRNYARISEGDLPALLAAPCRNRLQRHSDRERGTAETEAVQSHRVVVEVEDAPGGGASFKLRFRPA